MCDGSPSAAKEREWCVLYPNGHRVLCDSANDALMAASLSSATAQWRTTWLPVDEVGVPVRVAADRLPDRETMFDPAPVSAAVPPAEPREEVLAELQDGPKSSRELGCDTGFLRAMAEDGLVEIDKDMFPGEFVPGNPFIARLPGDTRRWPGWLRWNI